MRDKRETQLDILEVLALLFFVCLAGAILTGCDSPEVTAAIEREAYERKADVTPQEYFALIRPLDCDATVCARQSSRQNCLTRTRCYSKETK